MSSELVSIRCPGSLRKLFAKLRLDGERPQVVQPDNLIELYCYDCSKEFKNSPEYKGGKIRALHRYSFIGELIETEVVYLDE